MAFFMSRVNRDLHKNFLRKLLAGVLLGSLLLPASGKSAFAADAPKASEFYSASCALVDGYSGRLLYGKEEETARSNASTTKILTCIIALEESSVEDEVTASAKAAAQPKVRLGMSEGEVYRMEDLLYCLMLESYNDCAVAIAEHVAGSVEAFAALMNEKAARIGCADSYFITPNGLDAEDENGTHHTTALDLCLIMKYCAWDSPCSEQFLEITRTASYTFSDSKGMSHTATNHNQLLTTMDGALTGKTGFTADAGYCYVMAYEKDGKRFCAAFLACGWPNNKNYKWLDAKKLISYATENYTKQELYREPDFPEIELSGGCLPGAGLSDWGTNVTLKPCYPEPVEDSVCYMLSEEDVVSYRITYMDEPEAPLDATDIVGCYEIDLNGIPVRQYAVAAGEEVRRWDFWKLLFAIGEAMLQYV